MKNITKRICSLIAVFVIMAVTMVPAFADNTCDTGTQKLRSNCTNSCAVLYKMYGCIDYETTANTDGYPYGVDVTDSSGNPTTYFLKNRPSVNDMQVTVGTDGRLNIYGMGSGDANTWNQFFAKYKTVIVGISGIGAITFIALFIFQFMKLGASAGNPQARSQALTGCLWTGIAAAALGAVSIIAGFFYNAV